VRTRYWKLLLALLAMFSLTTAACGDDESGTSDTEPSDDAAEIPDGPDIAIGAQNFGESLVLAEIYKQGLEAKGYTASIEEVGGFRDLLFGAFESGDVNFAPDYVASQLEFLNQFAGEATPDVDETLALLEPRLTDRDLVAFTPSEAVDTNAFVVTGETSTTESLTTLSDLAGREDLTLGGFQDCETNAFCIPGLKEVYGVDLSANFTPLDAGLVPDALTNGDIDIGILISTDGRIESEGWVLLEDDKNMLAADNVFPVLTTEVADAYGDDFEEAVDAISAALTTEGLIELNKRYDVDKEDAADIAADFLADNDLA
jgi:osmoprotectant transport system substrate-binding protein